MSDWTRDPRTGQFIDWTKPPYREGSLLHLVLPGEDPHKISSAERQKRILEYYRLIRRDFRRTKIDAPEAVSPAGASGSRS